MAEESYSRSEKLLHAISLGNGCVRQVCLDLELSRCRSPLCALEEGKHVFIAGLARSGTTILMRAFYGTEQFVSLTYRDMPFVLMPSLWRPLSARFRQPAKKRERAHSDGIWVTVDSPEALEEVFWLTCDGTAYRKPDRLVPHQPNRSVITMFGKYVTAVLNGGDQPGGRYLSKNNNNILRLQTLCNALPGSLFLVPFRVPRQHADSLRRQHRHFIERHRTDPFATRYMRWLGHHEFGPDHRPFCLDATRNPFSPAHLDYWLKCWNEVYTWLLDTAPDTVIFVSYEHLCNDDNQTWRRLAQAAGIGTATTPGETFLYAEHSVSEHGSPDLVQACDRTYHRLLERYEQDMVRIETTGHFSPMSH